MWELLKTKWTNGPLVILREFQRPKDLRGSKVASTAGQILRKLRMTVPPRPPCITFLLLTCFLISRMARAAQPPEMRIVQSKYYLLHSDLDDALLYDLGTRMDAMYAEYSRRMADFDLRQDRK